MKDRRGGSREREGRSDEPASRRTDDGGELSGLDLDVKTGEDADVRASRVAGKKDKMVSSDLRRNEEETRGTYRK